MTLVDGEKAVARALDTAADGGGGSPVLRMRGPGREDTGLPISRESREPRAEPLLRPRHAERHAPSSDRPALRALSGAVTPWTAIAARAGDALPVLSLAAPVVRPSDFFWRA